jgi:hypothetical protein
VDAMIDIQTLTNKYIISTSFLLYFFYAHQIATSSKYPHAHPPKEKRKKKGKKKKEKKKEKRKKKIKEVDMI